jgi:hypothetical protein
MVSIILGGLGVMRSSARPGRRTKACSI